MAKVEKAKSGCFYDFLQVLLCPGNGPSPPVHPADNVIKSEKTELVHSKKDTMVDEYAATPGVVARLMGLDSLPKTNFSTKEATQDSVPRSRSVNFVDYLLEFDLNQSNNHRRVKTSASFREVPALAQWRNRDLFVPYWGDDKSKGEEEKSKKREKDLSELKQTKKKGSNEKENLKERVSIVKKEWNQGKNKKISKLKNEPRNVPSSYNRSRMVRKYPCEAKDLSNVSSRSNSPLSNKRKKGFIEPKLLVNKRNQKSNKKKIETENNSENLSPVSVLDCNDYPLLYETNSIENSHNTSPLTSTSKWKSSSLLSLGNGDIEGKASNNESCAYTDLNREAEYYSELLLKLRTLTEKDIRESNNNPNCIYGNEVELSRVGVRARDFYKKGHNTGLG
ncbi:hypothetical protein TanjilG_08905 [Lupinus angustifolius]|uniref:DUF3741 domain-containing protein n=1 Tax=Lupinus angustifolius TaxID=3871 RepID=A0A4P1RW38_LUPAN|nr:hypothetical protein TanjilG_08905 [Lupinus angustifolius]